MGRQDQAVYLIGSAIVPDTLGNQVKVPTERLVFGEELSVGAGEFYNAAVAGLRPEKRFEIYTREYQNEEKLKHNNVPYRIIRTEGRGERIRLSCERVAADG